MNRIIKRKSMNGRGKPLIFLLSYAASSAFVIDPEHIFVLERMQNHE